MSNEHLEFLPAVLEIQQSPPLPLGRCILWTIMLFFTISVVWAAVGNVDIVGVAQGKIVPGGRVKVIQPLETGVVKKIHVREGGRVKAGDPLIELDSTLAGADSDQVGEQLLALKLDRARLNTLLARIQGTGNRRQGANYEYDGGRFPDNVSFEQLQVMKQRIEAEFNEYRTRLAALKDEKRQRQAERVSVENRIQQLDSTIPLITERSNSLKELLETNMVPRVQWLELEEKRIEQVKERDVQQSKLGSLDAAIAGINQRISALTHEFESQRLSELMQTENRITALKQEQVKAEKRVSLQTLRAPVTGRVHQLSVHTIGGVVSPAQELMRIVPALDEMEIEAWVPNRDIGFVHEGQAAEIKIETFPFTRYGTIDGAIKTLSNDATPDERLGLVYATRVRMEKTTMLVKDRLINLSPGMAVTVEINMGKRKLIEYLLSPLLRYRDESVRER